MFAVKKLNWLVTLLIFPILVFFSTRMFQPLFMIDLFLWKVSLKDDKKKVGKNKKFGFTIADMMTIFSLTVLAKMAIIITAVLTLGCLCKVTRK